MTRIYAEGFTQINLDDLSKAERLLQLTTVRMNESVNAYKIIKELHIIKKNNPTLYQRIIEILLADDFFKHD